MSTFQNYLDQILNIEQGKERLRERIGDKIRFIRKQRGISQKDLADSSGIPQSNISKIENGRINISIDLLERLLCSMEVDLCIDLIQK